MLFDNSQSVTLRVHGNESLPSNRLTYEWKCRKWDCTTCGTLRSSKTKIALNNTFFSPCTGGNCKCKNSTSDETHVVEKYCLPDPFDFYKYIVIVRKTSWFRKWVKLDVASKCITVTPKEFTDVTIRYTACGNGLGKQIFLERKSDCEYFWPCSCDNCAPVDVNDNVKLRLNCVSTCPPVIWHIEDPKQAGYEMKSL